jgi:hypothetical protein
MQPVDLTGGYCWSTPFKVLGVLFLEEVCAAFLPSKKACGAYQFRYLGVDQQYPPVMWTPGLRHSAARKKCNKTQSKINVRLLAGTGGFWTGQAIPVSDFLCSGSRLSLGIGVEEPPAGARGITTGECYAAGSCHRALPLVAVVERTSRVRLAVIKADFEIPCATACS